MLAAAQGQTHARQAVQLDARKVFQWIISTYASALQAVLNHPAPVLFVMLVTVGISGYLYVKIPKGFFPQQDTGRLQGQVQGQQHISYQSLVEKAKWFEEQVRTDPDVDTVGVTAGSNGGGWGGAASAQIFVQLKPKRTTTPDQVIARIRQKTSGMPGATLYLQSQQDIRIGGRQSNAQYQYTLQTQDLDLLDLWGPRVLDKLSTLPELVDVSSDQQNSGLSSNVIIDRDTASRLGLTAQAVDSALYDAFGQRQVSTMYKSINQYHVVLALEQQWWESPDFLQKIYVQTPRGLSVPLSTFTHFQQGITPLSAAASGTISRHHDFVQSAGWRSLSATPCSPSTRPSWRWDCPRASPAVSPAPRRRFRILCRASPS